MPRPQLTSAFARDFPELSRPWTPSLPPAGEPAAWLVTNDLLAGELGIDPDWLAGPEALDVLGARAVLPGSTPVAQAYAGHQFGGYSPLLGDGRAVLLGESARPGGRLVDLALKGSGRTVFSRGGDGRAVIGPVLREYLFGESLHALGIPATRALAAVGTGDRVWREGQMPPGAVLTRVAASHLRVGTFELVRHLSGRPEAAGLCGRLVAAALQRHYPAAAQAGDSGAAALALLREVVAAQAHTIADWMAVGFLHGVMNTDNMAISGETIDFGPCAWLEAYDLDTVFSSIDTGGRYRFGNQPSIGLWNLSRFAESLLGELAPQPEAGVEVATEVLEGFAPRYADALSARLAAKLGLPAGGAQDAALIEDLLDILGRERPDWTSFWRELAQEVRGPEPADGFAGTHPQWWARYLDRLAGEDRQAVAERMDAVNPVYVPRNHLVEAALTDAAAGELGAFVDLLAAVRDPYVARPAREHLAGPAPQEFTARHVTYCGT